MGLRKGSWGPLVLPTVVEGTLLQPLPFGSRNHQAGLRLQPAVPPPALWEMLVKFPATDQWKLISAPLLLGRPVFQHWGQGQLHCAE